MSASPKLVTRLLSATLCFTCACVQAPLEAPVAPDLGAPDLASPEMTSPARDMDPPDASPVSCDAGLTACGRACVDLSTAPTSCGQCGRTCVLPHAKASCVLAECAIAQCEPGYFDLDRELANGCETQDSCMANNPCQTSCGSQGQTRCVEGMTLCAAPPEVCNAVDDDCNGQCDELAAPGCRRGIHRGHQGGGHIFTDDLAQIENVEAQNFFYLYQAEPTGSSGGGFKPVFLCNKQNGKKLLTSDLECEGAGGRVKQLGFWASQPVCGAKPLYRVFSEAAQNHFYTTSAPERDNAVNNLGYRDEGIAGYIWGSP